MNLILRKEDGLLLEIADSVHVDENKCTVAMVGSIPTTYVDSANIDVVPNVLIPEGVVKREYTYINSEFVPYIHPPIPLTLEESVEKLTADTAVLQDENLNVMLASAEMYEMQSQENLNLMSAIAELYEMNPGV